MYKIKITVFLLVAYLHIIVTASKNSKIVRPRPIISNGTEVHIGHLKHEFLFCYMKNSEKVANIHNYQMEWYRIQDKKKQKINDWEKSRLFRQNYFTLSIGFLVPHSYLIFQDFQKTEQGKYKCAITKKSKNGDKIVHKSWASIIIKQEKRRR
ncbi:UNVERIFIED_CONTAM: hypothetical protein RMT77_010751 [Armadillidium vulgare]